MMEPLQVGVGQRRFVLISERTISVSVTTVAEPTQVTLDGLVPTVGWAKVIYDEPHEVYFGLPGDGPGAAIRAPRTLDECHAIELAIEVSLATWPDWRPDLADKGYRPAPVEPLQLAL